MSYLTNNKQISLPILFTLNSCQQKDRECRICLTYSKLSCFVYETINIIGAKNVWCKNIISTPLHLRRDLKLTDWKIVWHFLYNINITLWMTSFELYNCGGILYRLFDVAVHSFNIRFYFVLELRQLTSNNETTQEIWNRFVLQ